MTAAAAKPEQYKVWAPDLAAPPFTQYERGQRFTSWVPSAKQHLLLRVVSVGAFVNGNRELTCEVATP